MEVPTGSASVSADPTAQQLFAYLQEREEALGLQEALVFFDFPLYSEEDQFVACKMLIASPKHGVIVIGTSNATHQQQIERAGKDVSLAFTHVYSRLFRNPALKKGMKALRVSAEALLFAPDAPKPLNTSGMDVPVVTNLARAEEFVQNLSTDDLSVRDFEETLSTIEGAKGLIRPRERNITDESSRAAAVSRLEEETNRFDLGQLEGYVTALDGPQRISGLAGSGKTVVLAMKAALTHLRHPKASIAFTFHTKSLYQHVRRLITRFYRQYNDQDPDWDRLHVLHAWGGKSTAGVYYNACLAAGVSPMTFGSAVGVPGMSPFDVACTELLKSTLIQPAYDFVFVDEGQDFKASFLQLSLKLAREGKMIFAYDQLQTIFQTTVPTIREIFGDEQLTLSLDLVLRKCYRNPLEILVVAHAVGFGLYGDRIRQMIEDVGHWNALGYDLIEGELNAGSLVRIRRPEVNSPSTISKSYTRDAIISADVCDTLAQEARAVSIAVSEAVLKDGLMPEDILVIAADDRNAKVYLSTIAASLRELGVNANNLQVESYGVQDFVREKHVTLTTIHKAKGNEAYLVFIVGIDALFLPTTVRSRNMAFTAMTRAKAWLRVSGVGPGAIAFKRELETARGRLPDLVFKYPSPEDLHLMKQDLQETDEQRVSRVLAELRSELPEAEFQRLVQQELKLVSGGRKSGSAKGRPKRG
jgi:superfamily I DNA and RNA helicase